MVRNWFRDSGSRQRTMARNVVLIREVGNGEEKLDLPGPGSDLEDMVVLWSENSDVDSGC